MGICEFEARLSYIVSSRPARVRVRPCLKKKYFLSVFTKPCWREGDNDTFHSTVFQFIS